MADSQVTLKTPAAKRVAEAESIIKKELSNLSDNVLPVYRILLTFTNIFLIAAKFAASHHGQDEVNSE